MIKEKEITNYDMDEMSEVAAQSYQSFKWKFYHLKYEYNNLKIRIYHQGIITKKEMK